MTEGEKMVWAAVFAKGHEELRHPPPEVLVPGKDEEWREWERDVLASAIERAGYAVQHLRGLEDRIREGHGPSDVYEFYKEMVYENPPGG